MKEFNERDLRLEKVAFRMDDIGASSKIHNQHGRVWWPVFGKNLPLGFFANWGGWKRQDPFRQWAPYPELTDIQWRQILNILRECGAAMTIGVTACWVESDGRLIPFDRKFPASTGIIKEGVEEGLLEVGNHGWTHCVLEGKAYLPRRFSSNRKYHREFWDWLGESIHREHLLKSQDILREIFRRDIQVFIPPGSVWADFTEKLAYQAGLRYLAARNKIYVLTADGAKPEALKGRTFDFHDRDLVSHGVFWLRDKIRNCAQGVCSISELVKEGQS